jgi:molecular chaperone GrpE
VVENTDLKDNKVEAPSETEEAPVAEKEEIAEPLDELATLRQRLEEEEAKAAEYLDGWQRARAELANARKRWDRESAQTYANALADSISKLLPAVDDFERAIETLPDNLSGLTWIDGVLLIYRRLQVILEQQGVEPIKAAAGTPFDPAYHQAITHEPHDTYEAGIIIGELQKGYMLNDRIVRPALVRVSAGPPAADADSSEPAE